MNDRQRFALAHPLQGDATDLARVSRPPLQHVRQRGDGALLVVVLAVDR